MLHFLLKNGKANIYKLYSYNNLDLLKNIYANGLLDIYANNGYAFRYSCELGYLDITKWLVSKGEELNNPIIPVPSIIWTKF